MKPSLWIAPCFALLVMGCAGPNAGRDVDERSHDRQPSEVVADTGADPAASPGDAKPKGTNRKPGRY